MQSQKAVTAYFSSKQLLPFGLHGKRVVFKIDQSTL